MRINSLSRDLNCLQINLRHSRMASLHLSQLLIDLNIDIAIIQEPYATNSDHQISEKYIPDNFISLHALFDDHTYGATILLKRFLNGQLLLTTCNNATVGVKLSINNSELFLFSLYCRPSIKNLNAHLVAFAFTLSTPVVKRAIFCLDSNAKNTFWNSATLDPKRKVVEYFFESIGATVANVPRKYLRHVPLNSSFIDVTVFWDLITLSDWKFLDIPSLSVHPFMSFTHRVETQPMQPKPFPNPAFCSVEKYLSLLPDAVNDLAPLAQQQSEAVRHYGNWETKCVALISAKLWLTLQKNQAAYSALKAEYQKMIRLSKAENFKTMCLTTNGLFGALKKPFLSRRSVPHSYMFERFYTLRHCIYFKRIWKSSSFYTFYSNALWARE